MATDGQYYLFGAFAVMSILMACGYTYYKVYMKNDHLLVPPTVIASTFVTVEGAQFASNVEFIDEHTGASTIGNDGNRLEAGNDMIPEPTENLPHAIKSNAIVAQHCIAYH